MACLVFTKCDPLQQLHIQYCTISGSVHLLPPPHPLWSIFCVQAISIVIFLFSFFGALWILLSATAILGQNSHVSIPRCAHLVVLQTTFNKKVSIIGLSMHVRQAGGDVFAILPSAGLISAIQSSESEQFEQELWLYFILALYFFTIRVGWWAGAQDAVLAAKPDLFLLVKQQLPPPRSHQ